MKILLITPYFFEPHRWMMSSYLAAKALSRTDEVLVITTGKPGVEQSAPRLRIYRLRDLFFPDPVNYSIVPGLLPVLWKVVRKEKPDVYLIGKFMFFTSLSIPFLRLIGKRVITMTDTFPGYNWFPRSLAVRLIMKAYFYLIGLPLLRMSNTVVLLHEGLIPDAQRLKLRYRVIPNGVDAERIDMQPPSVDIPHDKQHVNIGYVGRLESIKGYDDLIAVAEQTVRHDSRLHYYFIGNIVGKEEFVRRHANSQIHFLGHRWDVGAIYKRLDIFVLPSYAEGLPNALLEAMYCGIACVASRVGGVTTLIQDGKNGLLVQPGDRTGFEECMMKLVRDKELRLRLGESARKTIRRSFTWETILLRYHSLFREMIKERQ